MNPIKTIIYKIVWINQATEEQGDVVPYFECPDTARAIMEREQEKRLGLEFDVVEDN